MPSDLDLPDIDDQDHTRHLRRLSELAAIRFRLRAAIYAARLDAEEQKFNPNHDELGRFTTGAGTTTGTASDAQARQARRDALVRAQNKVMTDPVLTQSNPTHCNQATVQVLQAVGAPVGDLTDAQGHPLTANAMADALATSKDWREVKSTEASVLANNGNPVIASWKNPGGNPNDRHGHIATVRPTDVSGDKVGAGSGPLLANVGGQYSGVRPQSGAIRSDRQSAVKYYVPVLRPTF